MLLKTLSAKDIIVISPNQVFNDYISDVLPDLGEENMQQTTFYQIVRALLGKLAPEGVEIEDNSTHLEYLFGKRGSPGYALRVKEVQYKGSPAFFAEVQKYIQRLHQGQEIACPDIVYDGHVVISAGEIRELVTKTYNYLPYSKRLDKVGRRIRYLLEPFREERLAAAVKRIESDPKHQDLNRREVRQLARTLVEEEFRPIDDAIQQLTAVDVLRHYANVFRQPDAPKELQAIGEAVVGRLAQGKIAYDDIAPILYLAAALGEIQGDRQIRHVVIDEAQDYSRFHYEVFRRLYPSATFTVLGDPAQSIHPYLNTVELETIERAIAPGDAQVIRLHMTYRSTKEIVQFSRAIDSSEGGAHPVDRHGAKPLILEVADPARFVEAAAAQVRELHEAGARSVAIICKTAAQSQEVYAGLKERLPVHLVTADDDTLPRGDLVIPAYLAKGLEFDGVLIYDASANVYHDESERKLFYTACTRALHHLRLMYTGRLTPFLDDLSPGLAERAAFPARGEARDSR